MTKTRFKNSCQNIKKLSEKKDTKSNTNKPVI